MQDEGLVIDLRDPFVVDLLPEFPGQRFHFASLNGIHEILLCGKPLVPVYDHVDIRGRVFKSYKKGAGASCISGGNIEEGYEFSHSFISFAEVSDLLFGFPP